jgi:hypothetical protein
VSFFLPNWEITEKFDVAASLKKQDLNANVSEESRSEEYG